jgi:hypothetical protein
MPTRNNTKISADLFISYVVFPLDLFKGDARVRLEDSDKNTEFEIAQDENNPECYGVIELYREIGPVLVFASKDLETANRQMNRRIYHLNKLHA